MLPFYYARSLWNKLHLESLYILFQNALNRHWTYVYFTNGAFCFHVSFLCFNLLIINAFEGWNIRLLCFIFSFNVSFKKNTEGEKQKHCGSDLKTLWERFKNTVGAIQKHWGSDNALPQRFEKWNMKLKMKHWSSMFHFSKWLIFNELKHKNETWKIKQRFWIRMDICSINCNLSA